MPRFDARRAYNRIGRLQDTQSFYEQAAVEDLVAHLALSSARLVMEIGCGTGKLAAGLLQRELSGEADYIGTDVSDKMVELAERRVAPYGGRAQVARVEAGSALPETARAPDRVIAVYVLDLLSDSETDRMLHDIGNRLGREGLLGIVSLAPGAGGLPRRVSDTWTAIWRRFPAAVGGCRPVDVETALSKAGFYSVYSNTVISWAVTSHIVVAQYGHRP